MGCFLPNIARTAMWGTINPSVKKTYIIFTQRPKLKINVAKYDEEKKLGSNLDIFQNISFSAELLLMVQKLLVVPFMKL